MERVEDGAEAGADERQDREDGRQELPEQGRGGPIHINWKWVGAALGVAGAVVLSSH